MRQTGDKLPDSVTFCASFPSANTAIQMHGDAGMRITLDIPESDVPNALLLTRWRGVVLEVTVTPQ